MPALAWRTLPRMSTSSFETATAIDCASPGRYECFIQKGWAQGRSVFGGISAAVLTRALTAEAGDPARPLRSVTIHFCGPLQSGPAHVEARLESESSRVSHASARLVQGDRVMAIGAAMFGADRPPDVDFHEGVMPDAIPIERAVSVPHTHQRPEFTQRLDILWCGGEIPMSGAERASLRFWTRLRGVETLDAAALVALTDASPPAFFTRLTAARPVATVTFTAHLLVARPMNPPGGAFVMSTRDSCHTSDGYSTEALSLWSADGKRLVQATQVVALIK